MPKVIITALIGGLLIGLLIWSTPVARLGAGFLIGDGRLVFTYYDLVLDAENFLVKFPNEDDIPAQSIFKDKMENLAILELEESPKIKREPLSLNAGNAGLEGKYVFFLGYPWTNTLEDRHTFVEGSLTSLVANANGLLEIQMEVDPIHSGSPLFNENREVVGMVISAQTMGDRSDYKGKLNLAIPAPVLNEVLLTQKIAMHSNSTATLNNLPIEEFIEASRNNIVLIEAR